MDYCPSCERDFDGFFDYPRVFVSKINRFPIYKIVTGKRIARHEIRKTILGREKVIPLIPQEALELLRNAGESESVPYKGVVYKKINNGIINLRMEFASYEDITESVKKAVESENVQMTLSRLESLVGVEIVTDKIREIVRSTGKINIRDETASLGFHEPSHLRNEYLFVRLFGYLSGSGCTFTYFADRINVRLAEIAYEGRINSPEMSRKI